MSNLVHLMYTSSETQQLSYKRKPFLLKPPSFRRLEFPFMVSKIAYGEYLLGYSSLLSKPPLYIKQVSDLTYTHIFSRRYAIPQVWPNSIRIRYKTAQEYSKKHNFQHFWKVFHENYHFTDNESGHKPFNVPFYILPLISSYYCTTGVK